MAEGEGVEPLALLRCQPGFRDRLPAAERHLPLMLAEGIGIEPMKGFRPYCDLASRCIAALPTFRARRMIGIANCGATGMDSNLQPHPYERSALPLELRWHAGFVFGSFPCGDYT